MSCRAVTWRSIVRRPEMEKCGYNSDKRESNKQGLVHKNNQWKLVGTLTWMSDNRGHSGEALRAAAVFGPNACLNVEPC